MHGRFAHTVMAVGILSTAELIEWLKVVPGLSPQELGDAAHFLNKHSVDGEFLDFLASAAGSRVLAAHRSNDSQSSSAKAVSCTTADAQAKQPDSAATQQTASASTRGRQRISLEARRNERHYYRNVALPEPRSRTQNVRNVEKSSRAADSVAPQSPSTCAEDAGNPQGATAAEWATGMVKSYNVETGYGFLWCAKIKCDVFLGRSELPAEGSVEPGRKLRFALTYDSKGRPQAKCVSWLPSSPRSAPQPTPTGQRRYLGYLKSVGGDYGFLACEEVRSEYGRDVYVARSQLPANWKLQMQAAFHLALSSRGQPQARDIQWDPRAAGDSEAESECDAQDCGPEQAASVAAKPASRW